MPDELKFFDDESIRRNIVLSALYLLAYELLKDAIINNIRDFFSLDFDDQGTPIPSEQYKAEVTKDRAKLLYASCQWLVRNEVITEDESGEILRIREHRNQVAHELPKLLIDPELELNVNYLWRIRELLRKIESWWFMNVEVPSNPEYDGKIVSMDDYQAGRKFIIDRVISVFLEQGIGDEE